MADDLAVGEDGDGVQYVVQGEDGSMQPFIGDPPPLGLNDTGDGVVNFASDQHSDGYQVIAGDGEEPHLQYISSGDASTQHVVQYVTADGQIIQDPNLGMEQQSGLQYVSENGDAMHTYTTDTSSHATTSQIQYVTEDGTPVDPSMVNANGTLITESDQLVTTTEQSEISNTFGTEDSQPVTAADSNALSTVQYVTDYDHGSQSSSGDQGLQVTSALSTGTSVATSDAVITSITPHVPEDVNEGTVPTEDPSSQDAHDDDVQFIMDPQTGTIYTLKGGKATVLTAEANIIMDDPASLNLPTQTAKVLPDSSSISKDSESNHVTDETSITENMKDIGSMESDPQPETSQDINTAGGIIPPDDEIVTNVADALNSSTPPDPMKPPAGDVAKVPDVVYATVPSEETETSSTVMTRKASPTAHTTSPAPPGNIALIEDSPKPTTPRQKPLQSVKKTPTASPKPAQKTVFKCELCEFRSTQKPAVFQHLVEVHIPSRMMMCTKCKKGFNTKALCDAHQAECGEPTESHRCSQCTFTTDSKAQLDDHVTDRHTPKPALLCEHCSFASTSKKELTEHLESQHPETVMDISQKKSLPGLTKTTLPKVTTSSGPIQDSFTHQLTMLPVKTEEKSTPAPAVPLKHASLLKSENAATKPKAAENKGIRIVKGSPGMAIMKKIVFSKQARKEALDIENNYNETHQTSKSAKNRIRLEPTKPILKVESNIQFGAMESEEEVVANQQAIAKNDRKLQVESKVCLLKMENFVPISEAVQLITKKSLQLRSTIQERLTRRPHPADLYAKINPKKWRQETHHLTQKRDHSSKFMPTTNEKNPSEQVEVKKKVIHIPEKKPIKKIDISAKIKSVKRKPSIMDKFFDDTRGEYEATITSPTESEGGRSRRKRKPKMFGDDFVNSEYLTAKGVLSDEECSSNSASLHENLSDSELDEEMEDEEENPNRKRYKKHPSSILQKERSRKKSVSQRDGDFDLDDTNDFTDELPRPKQRKKKKSVDEKDFSLSEIDGKEERPRKRSKYDNDAEFKAPSALKKRAPKCKQKVDSEEEFDAEELERLEEMLYRGEEIEKVADEAINEAALQESPVKKSLFLGETLHREPKAKGRGRKRKASYDGAPGAKQRKTSIDSIRKPIILQKHKQLAEGGEQGGVMVTYSDDTETGEDEDSREALLRQYAAAVKVTDGSEDDPAKRKRKKKSFGDEFLTHAERVAQEQDLKVLAYMKHPIGRPPKGYIKPEKEKKPPKMKHTGSLNNPKRGPGRQPKFSLPIQESNTPSPTLVVQRRVDGMPSPSSQQEQPQQKANNLPWVGKLSNILNEVQKTTGEGAQNTGKVDQTQGQLGGKKYSLVEQNGKIVMIPLSASPKRAASPGASVVPQSTSVLKIARSPAVGSGVATVSPSNPTIISTTSKQGSVVKSLPPGTKLIKVNGKTYVCKAAPKPETILSPSQGVAQKVNLLPQKSITDNETTKITFVDSSHSSAAGATSVGSIASVVQAPESKAGASGVPRIIRIQSKPSAVRTPGSSTVQVVRTSNGGNDHGVQRSLVVPQKGGRGQGAAASAKVVHSHGIHGHQPRDVMTIVSSAQPHLQTLQPKPPTMTLFPKGSEPPKPAFMSQSNELIQDITLPQVLEVRIPSTVASASQESVRSSATTESGGGMVELDPSDLLANMADSGDGDIGVDLNQLPGFDSSNLLDPHMQEMLDLL